MPDYHNTLDTAAGMQASDTDLTVIAGLSPSNDDLLQRKSGVWVNRTPTQVKTDLAFTKGDIGLGNADNTSDVAKPVSTAQQAALDGKIDDYAAVVPADHGLAGWAYDPAHAVATIVLTGGTLYLAKVAVPAAVTVTKIYWHVGVVGVSATAGQNHVGLYNTSGTRLATTGVDSDVTSTGLKTTTISGTALTAGQTVWVGVLFNAVTPPALACTSLLVGAAGLVNAGLAASAYRFATNGTGLTSLPSSVTPSSASAGAPLWAAVGA